MGFLRAQDGLGIPTFLRQSEGPFPISGGLQLPLPLPGQWQARPIEEIQGEPFPLLADEQGQIQTVLRRGPGGGGRIGPEAGIYGIRGGPEAEETPEKREGGRGLTVLSREGRRLWLTETGRKPSRVRSAEQIQLSIICRNGEKIWRLSVN